MKPSPPATADLVCRWSELAREWLAIVVLSMFAIAAAGVCMWREAFLLAVAGLMFAGGLLYRAVILARYLSALVGRIEHRNRTEE